MTWKTQTFKRLKYWTKWRKLSNATTGIWDINFNSLFYKFGHGNRGKKYRIHKKDTTKLIDQYNGAFQIQINNALEDILNA